MAYGDLRDIYQQGNGQAFILPQSGATDVFLNGLEKNRVLKKAAIDNELAKRAAFEKDVNENISKLTPGDYWSQYTPDIQKGFSDVMSKATSLKAKGVDPFSNNEFKSDYEALKARAKATGELKTSYEDFYKEFGKNPDGYDNGLEIMNNYKNAKLDDYIAGNFNPGQLQKKYSLADAIEESKGTISYQKNNDGTYDTTKVNRSGNVGQGVASLSTVPAQYLIKKAGGDVGPYIDGFPTITPDGRTFYNTKGKDLENS